MSNEHSDLSPSTQDAHLPSDDRISTDLFISLDKLLKKYVLFLVWGALLSASIGLAYEMLTFRQDRAWGILAALPALLQLGCGVALILAWKKLHDYFSYFLLPSFMEIHDDNGPIHPISHFEGAVRLRQAFSFMITAGIMRLGLSLSQALFETAFSI